MASSGTKRPYADDAISSSGRSDRSHEDRRAKPKDWRDAFLDDSPRRRDSERSRERDPPRRRDDYGDRYGHGQRDRERDRRRDFHDRDAREGQSSRDRDRDRDRDRNRRDHREHDREDYSRRHGDRSDRHRDDRNDRRKTFAEREEGELEPSPPRPSTGVPVIKTPQNGESTVNAKPSNGIHRSPPSGPRASFQPLSMPSNSQPSNYQNRPQALGNMFDAPVPAKDEDKDEHMTVLEEERDAEKILAERRRKREEILAKFKANGDKAAIATPSFDTKELPGPGAGAESVTSAGYKTGLRTGLTSTGATPLLRQLGTRSTSLAPSGMIAGTPVIAHEPSLASTPMGNDFDLSKQIETVGGAALPSGTKDEGVGADMMISAADYDPTREAMVDQEKRRKDMEAVKVEPKDVAEGVGEPLTVDEKPQVEDEYEEVEIEEEEEDDEFDMFAAFGEEAKEKKKRKVVVRRLKNGAKGDGTKPQIIKKPASTIAPEVVDNVDDTEGYYRITPGEIIDDGRYQITITLGKGMFSAVVKAKVLKAVNQERRQDVVGKEVAIKVMRSQESMYISGRKESQILKKLNDADPDDKKHIVRMERTFEHRGHFCIVTESLSMNLRDVIKRFGKDVGLNMRAVRAYAHQMLLALSLMRKCSIVHADIKPDNILVSENKATLKVCDLGSAAEITEGEITPYLVSRFYRAPEIILGLPYDSAIDMWSIGCTLYELYTGKILFPGRSNNHMLLLMMELKGKLNHRMIKKASFGTMHFDESLNFISIERDKITGLDVAKTLVISKATRDLRARLVPSSSVQLKMKDEELKQLLNFVDLLDKCLQLDPARRITHRDALLHPFMSG